MLEIFGILVGVWIALGGLWAFGKYAIEAYQRWRGTYDDLGFSKAFPQNTQPPTPIWKTLSYVLIAFNAGLALWWWEAGRHLECTGPIKPPVEFSGYQ